EARRAELSVNYRTPAEVMAAAAPVIRAALPDANVPTSARQTGVPVQRIEASQVGAAIDAVLAGWLAAHPDGTAVVIGAPLDPPRPRVSTRTPMTAKGLEFDLVVLVDPDRFADGVAGTVDRYVAMTRATRELVVISGPPASSALAPA